MYLPPTELGGLSFPTVHLDFTQIIPCGFHIYIYMCVYVHIYFIHICKCVCPYVHIYIYSHSHIHTHISIHTFLHKEVRPQFGFFGTVKSVSFLAPPNPRSGALEKGDSKICCLSSFLKKGYQNASSQAERLNSI